jgi:hypothetical protein
MNHNWFYFEDNPTVLNSEPHGWLIMKHARPTKHYTLHLEDSGDVKPVRVHDHWEPLAEYADRVTL